MESEQGTCEMLITDRVDGPKCGDPATVRYPAMGGGYMRLCVAHGRRFSKSSYCEDWTGTEWVNRKSK